MTPSLSPTIRRRRLARILRELREETGQTLEVVAKRTGVPKTTLGRLETAELKRIRPGQLDELAKTYGVSEEAWSSLQQLAKDANERGWWSQYKDVFKSSGLPSFEVEASYIRTFEAQVIPGLLQTPEYTRAVFTGTMSVSPEKIQRHVSGRSQRQEILDRLYPPEYVAIIDESALRRPAGSIAFMVEQLRHLIELSERPRVAIHVLPFAAGMHGANLGGFQIMEFPEATDPTIAYTETPTSTLFVEEADEIRRYDAMWREAHSASLTAAQTVDFIQKIIGYLESDA